MTFRRAILIVLLIVLSILLIYNSYIAPLFVRGYNQMGMGMGMGMHGRMWGYSSYNSFVDFRVILLLIIVIAALFLFDILSPGSVKNRCINCGNDLEDDWSICPICGSRNKARKDV